LLVMGNSVVTRPDASEIRRPISSLAAIRPS